MTWNYRLVRIPSGEKDETYYRIHEAFYENDGRCYAVTMDGVDIGGETIEECKRAYKMMSEAFNKPVLDYETREDLPDARQTL